MLSFPEYHRNAHKRQARKQSSNSDLSKSTSTYGHHQSSIRRLPYEMPAKKRCMLILTIHICHIDQWIQKRVEVIRFQKCLNWYIATIQGGLKCNYKNFFGVSTFVVFDGDPELYHVLTQGLPHRIRHLNNLVKICNDLERCVVLEAELMNGYIFFSIAIGQVDSRDGGVNYCAQQIVHIFDLTSGVNLQLQQLSCFWNAHKATYWNRAF